MLSVLLSQPSGFRPLMRPKEADALGQDLGSCNTCSAAAAKILDRLEKVKATKTGSWLARCPAHDDNGPSLSIRETSDGRVLIHCFAGCEPGEVLKAIDLNMTALFERSLEHHLPPSNGGFSAAELLALIAHETWVAAIVTSDAAKRPLTDEERLRLVKAAGRIWKVQELSRG